MRSELGGRKQSTERRAESISAAWHLKTNRKVAATYFFIITSWS